MGERPASGPGGTVVTLYGAGFLRRHLVVIGVGRTRLAVVRTDSRGAFTTAVAIPRGRPRLVSIKARDHTGHTISRFGVTRGTGPGTTAEVVSEHGDGLRWTPSSAAAGQRLKLRGSGFPRRARGALSWVTGRARLRISRGGSFSRTLRIPANAAGSLNGTVRVRNRRLGFVVSVGASGARQAPANRSLPTIGGEAREGVGLAANPGAWDGSPPIAYAYQWRRCDAAGANCADIAGAAAAAYTVTAGDVGHRLIVAVTAANAYGSATAASPPTAAAVSASAPSGASDAVIAAAGDIACDPADPNFNGGAGTSRFCRQAAVYRLVASLSPTAVLALGDLQYEDGTLAKYQASYDLSWGKLKGITFPTPGNDHDQSGGGGYISYWQSRLPSSAPYQPYSFDLGRWHLISLPSNCKNANIDCSSGGTLDRWLKADLAAHANRCTLAFFHNPRWNSPSTRHPSHEFAVDAFAADLYAAGADVLLSADNHDYERFAPQDPSDHVDQARGLTQFVVGTGGKTVFPFTGTAPNSVARDDQHFGALQMTLHPTGYDWRFVTETGAVGDAGSAACH